MKEALKTAIECLKIFNDNSNGDPTYAHAIKVFEALAQRTWVGLTEARIKEIWLNGKDHGDDWLDVLALARAFEADLKEKNA